MDDIISAFMSNKEYICISISDISVFVAGLFGRFGAISIKLFTEEIAATLIVFFRVNVGGL